MRTFSRSWCNRRWGGDLATYIGLTDNYERYAGYKPTAKFGLITIDYDKPPNNYIASRILTKRAQAPKLIIEKSFSEDKHGVATDIALSQAREIYGSFMPDGSRIV